MHQILQEILKEKYFEVLKRKQKGLYFRPFWDRPAFDLRDYIFKEGFIIIAEVKRASPLKGSLRKDFDPIWLAQTYQASGAKAISVITEEVFFLGSLEYMAGIRMHTSLPLLRKDFLLDPVQIEEAKAFGADFILLIAGILTKEELREMNAYAHKLGLSALIEVHTEEDLEKALSCEAKVVGINNRDLSTLKVDPLHSFKLLKKIPSHIAVIAESGIRTPMEVWNYKKSGFKGVLIGTSLVQQPDPSQLLRQMVEGCQ